MNTIAYLASRYARHPEMRLYRDFLEAYGWTINARWIEGEHEMGYGDDVYEFNNRCAMEDIEDILRADVFIVFTERPDEFSERPTGGRWVELGMAWTYEKEIHIIGPRENVFCYMDDIDVHEDWQAFVYHMFPEHFPTFEITIDTEPKLSIHYSPTELVYIESGREYKVDNIEVSEDVFNREYIRRLETRGLI